MQGIIIKMLSGFYYVKTERGVITCRARGIMRKNAINPLVGDRVVISVNDDSSGVLEEVLPRQNFLIRPPVANVDKLFIVSSYTTPKPNSYIIDTLIAICEYKGIEPILVFNKSDLGDFSEFIDCYSKAGYKTILTSAKKGEGTQELRNEFCDNVSVLTGNSGVGKSSLLNLFLEDVIKTGDVSEKLGRGRHTTRHTEIYPIPSGGYVADTPGFSEIEAIKNDYAFKENLECFFKEFEEYIPQCKFTCCSHNGEKGCAVARAADDGFIGISRLESYRALYKELKDLKKWEVEKSANR
ncbi:MAG: ribosome small subunit-dependent GTPase A [Clostridia bacterium]|nr:ribosome small subunit-dependent GTPase A [Clostridia bacterium]